MCFVLMRRRASVRRCFLISPEWLEPLCRWWQRCSARCKCNEFDAAKLANYFQIAKFVCKLINEQTYFCVILLWLFLSPMLCRLFRRYGGQRVCILGSRCVLRRIPYSWMVLFFSRVRPAVCRGRRLSPIGTKAYREAHTDRRQYPPTHILASCYLLVGEWGNCEEITLKTRWQPTLLGRFQGVS